MTKIAGSGSISQKHGSADPDPDPPQNVMDPQQHSSLFCRTVDGSNGGAADEVRVLLVHRLQLHPHLEPVHLGRGRLLLEAPAGQGGCNYDILLPNGKMQQRSFRYLTWELLLNFSIFPTYDFHTLTKNFFHLLLEH
jgi:hypothetical protein